MTLLNTLNVGGTEFGVQSSLPMGTCATPAGTEIKAAVFADDFELSAGNLISVTFTYANTYGNGSTTYPKLTVNGTNYPIVFPTGEYAGSGAWANGQIITFMYDGTNLVMTSVPKIQTTDQVISGSALPVTSGGVYNSFFNYTATKGLTEEGWYKIATFGLRQRGTTLTIEITSHYNNSRNCAHIIHICYGWTNVQIFDFAQDAVNLFSKIKICWQENQEDSMALYVYYSKNLSNNCYARIRGNALNITTHHFTTDSIVWDTTREQNLGTDGFYINGENRLPAAPTTDGAYNLKCTVTSGIPTYSWT